MSKKSVVTRLNMKNTRFKFLEFLEELFLKKGCKIGIITIVIFKHF